MHLKHAKAFACILIVIYHALSFGSKLQSGNTIKLHHFFGEIFFYGRVPFFFVVAGYLFHHSYTRSGSMIGTVGKRVKNLVPPYFFWNSVMMAMVLMGSTLGFSYRDQQSFSAYEYVKMVSGVGSIPANEPLWFVRDLILLFLISPLIIRLRGLLPYIGLIALLISINYQDARFFKIVSLGFYSIGVYMYQLIQPKELEERLSLIPKKSIYVFLASMFCIALINQSQIMPAKIGILGSFLGVSMIVMIGELLSRGSGLISKTSLAVSESSFLIYVSHIPILRIFLKSLEQNKTLIKLIHVVPIFNVIICLLLSAIIVFVTSYIDRLIKRKFPNCLIVITGSR